MSLPMNMAQRLLPCKTPNNTPVDVPAFPTFASIAMQYRLRAPTPPVPNPASAAILEKKCK